MQKKQSHELNVRLVYKNFAARQGISHIGLGVSALNNAKTLQTIGVNAHVLPVKDEQDLVNYMKHHHTVTHVVIQAPWISTMTLATLCASHPETQFIVVSHSNVGFLQADRNGIKLIKEAIHLENSTYNFHVGGNSLKFCKWVENTFGEPCTWLPNMYFLHHKHGDTKRLWRDCGGTLKIGCFGATRSLKNMLSSVGAAMEIASDLGAHTEVWVNTEREDGPESKHILAAAHEMLYGMPNIELKKYPWASWGHFKRFVGTMHLLLQPSYTESFNMVTADGVSEGVPSVVSDAITWAPSEWRASVDDVNDIARKGVCLLNDPEAARRGFEALKQHNRLGERAWLEYLCSNRFGNPC